MATESPPRTSYMNHLREQYIHKNRANQSNYVNEHTNRQDLQEENKRDRISVATNALAFGILGVLGGAAFSYSKIQNSNKTHANTTELKKYDFIKMNEVIYDHLNNALPYLKISPALKDNYLMSIDLMIQLSLEVIKICDVETNRLIKDPNYKGMVYYATKKIETFDPNDIENEYERKIAYNQYQQNKKQIRQSQELIQKLEFFEQHIYLAYENFITISNEYKSTLIDQYNEYWREVGMIFMEELTPDHFEINVKKKYDCAKYIFKNGTLPSTEDKIKMHQMLINERDKFEDELDKLSQTISQIEKDMNDHMIKPAPTFKSSHTFTNRDDSNIFSSTNNDSALNLTEHTDDLIEMAKIEPNIQASQHVSDRAPKTRHQKQNQPKKQLRKLCKLQEKIQHAILQIEREIKSIENMLYQETILVQQHRRWWTYMHVKYLPSMQPVKEIMKIDTPQSTVTSNTLALPSTPSSYSSKNLHTPSENIYELPVDDYFVNIPSSVLKMKHNRINNVYELLPPSIHRLTYTLDEIQKKRQCYTNKKVQTKNDVKAESQPLPKNDDSNTFVGSILREKLKNKKIIRPSHDSSILQKLLYGMSRVKQEGLASYIKDPYRGYMPSLSEKIYIPTQTLGMRFFVQQIQKVGEIIGQYPKNITKTIEKTFDPNFVIKENKSQQFLKPQSQSIGTSVKNMFQNIRQMSYTTMDRIFDPDNVHWNDEELEDSRGTLEYEFISDSDDDHTENNTSL